MFAPRNEVAANPVDFCRLCGAVANVLHDRMGLFVHLRLAPTQALAVLAHYQFARGNANRIDRLAARNDHVLLLHQEVQRVVRRQHIYSFDVVFRTGECDLLSFTEEPLHHIASGDI